MALATTNKRICSAEGSAERASVVSLNATLGGIRATYVELDADGITATNATAVLDAATGVTLVKGADGQTITDP